MEKLDKNNKEKEKESQLSGYCLYSYTTRMNKQLIPGSIFSIEPGDEIRTYIQYLHSGPGLTSMSPEQWSIQATILTEKATNTNNPNPFIILCLLQPLLAELPGGEEIDKKGSKQTKLQYIIK